MRHETFKLLIETITELFEIGEVMYNCSNGLGIYANESLGRYGCLCHRSLVIIDRIFPDFKLIYGLKCVHF